jgi:hypothetical protein
MKSLWLDEGGAILSFELMMLLVGLVIGVSIGMVILRDAVISEYQCVAAAVNSLNPGYAWSDLIYDGGTSSAMVNGTDASVTTLGIGVGSGVIQDSISSGGEVFPVTDSMPAVTITSP